MREWFVYIIAVNDGSLYTGITTDLSRRFKEHRTGRLGAKYFRGRKPVETVFVEGGHTRSSASTREHQIKRLTRAQKKKLISNSH